MNKLFIIDAVNYLFRSYFAISPMTNDEGNSTQALFGFIRSINKLINDFSPTHLVAVFDGPDNKQSRQKVYAEYKMHRKKAPDDLYPQIELAYQYCELIGIPVLSVPGVEADDAMAAIALWGKENNYEVYLCTSDKDLFQLVGGSVYVLNVNKDNLIMDSEKVKEKYGVMPNQMLDLLAIMGDASDNIPGIPGFGPKTAATLLNQYGTLDGIYEHLEEISGKKKTTLEENKDLAYLSQQLATLNTDITIPQKETFYHLQMEPSAELEAFFRQMKFFTLLKEAPTTPVSQKTDYTIIYTESELISLFDKLEKEKQICIDTETTGLDPYQDTLVGIGLAIKPFEAFYIPTNADIPLATIVQQLKRLTENTSIGFVGHNIKFDCHVLARHKLYLKNIAFDTLLASYLLNPQNRRHNLDRLALEIFNYNKISYDSLTKEGRKTRSLDEVEIDRVGNYCCEDVDITLRLQKHFEKELKKHELWQLFTTIEMPLIHVLFEMEEKGIFIDTAWFKKLSEKLSTKLAGIQVKIFSLAGKEFNLNSPKQLSGVLYEDLNLPAPKKKGSSLSTAAAVLEKLAEDYEIVSLILDYRSVQKLLSTYVDTLPLQVNPKTHRIHATFNQSITATGRLSCQDPNLQNIPIRSEEGKEIRKGFIPEKQDWSYLAADYSQIELRLLAHFSEDPNLLTAFNQKEDIHRATAALIFGVDLDQVTPQMRYQAKAVNFGIIYGQGAFGLSEQLQIPMKEAAEFIKKYFSHYPQIEGYIQSCKEKADQTTLATTLFGRKRPIPDIHNNNPHIRAAAERLAINTPLQGTQADLIKMSMIKIQKEIEQLGLQGYMILQIHDELIFELPDEEIPIFSKFVKEIMQNIHTFKVPIIVDIAIGKNWGEC